MAGLNLCFCKIGQGGTLLGGGGLYHQTTHTKVSLCSLSILTYILYATEYTVLYAYYTKLEHKTMVKVV
jgi:hypothetical protein